MPNSSERLVNFSNERGIVISEIGAMRYNPDYLSPEARSWFEEFDRHAQLGLDLLQARVPVRGKAPHITVLIKRDNKGEIVYAPLWEVDISRFGTSFGEHKKEWVKEALNQYDQLQAQAAISAYYDKQSQQRLSELGRPHFPPTHSRVSFQSGSDPVDSLGKGAAGLGAVYAGAEVLRALTGCVPQPEVIQTLTPSPTETPAEVSPTATVVIAKPESTPTYIPAEPYPTGNIDLNNEFEATHTLRDGTYEAFELAMNDLFGKNTALNEADRASVREMLSQIYGAAEYRLGERLKEVKLCSQGNQWAAFVYDVNGVGYYWKYADDSRLGDYANKPILSNNPYGVSRYEQLLIQRLQKENNTSLAYWIDLVPLDVGVQPGFDANTGWTVWSNNEMEWFNLGATTPNWQVNSVEVEKPIEPTSTTEATQTAEIKELRLVEFDNRQVQLFGKPVRVVIGTDEISDIRKNWEHMGIVSLQYNADVQGLENKLGKMYEGIFWAISEAGESNTVTFKDFMRDPDKYSITLPTKIPGKMSVFGSVTFKPTEVKQINIVYVPHENTDYLYTNYRRTGGFEFKDGVLTIYNTTLPDEFSFVTDAFKQQYGGKGGEHYSGGQLGWKALFNLLQIKSERYVDDLAVIQQLSNVLPPVNITEDLNMFMDWAKKNSFWQVVW